MPTRRLEDINELLATVQHRDAQFDRASANEEQRTIEVAFSSEEPVERWYGMEILSHARDAVDLSRLSSGRANVLFNHNRDDYLGIIETARIDKDRRGRALLRFGSSDRAKQIYRDAVDGILPSISVGYRAQEAKLTRSSEEDGDEYTVTRWQPFEISFVTIPADASVGVGRSANIPPAKANNVKELKMDQGNQPAGTAAVVTDNNPAHAAAAAQLNAAGAAATTERILALDAERRRGIENLCRMNNIDENMRSVWISSGASMAQVSDDMLKILQERGKSNPQSEAKLGLSAREADRYSLTRAILAVHDGNWNAAGFEAECSREIANRLGRTPDQRKFFVPYEVQQRALPTPADQIPYQLGKRDLTVASAASAGYLVNTANMGFIELLRNRSVMFNMGAMRLSGLRDSITIPKQTGAGTAIWLANEGSTITESNQTFTQIAATPKHVGGYTEISRQLLLQSSPAVEGLVNQDLATVVSLAIDLAGLNGSGSGGQPTGILNTSGIGAVTGTSIDYADIVEFQTDVFAGNALNADSGYVTTGAVAGLLKTRVKFSSTASPIWDGRLDMANVDGHRGMASNQMPAATMIFGDFGQVVVCEWGVLEVEVNPFANFQAGIIGVRAIAAIDIIVRYPTAFSAASSIT